MSKVAPISGFPEFSPAERLVEQRFLDVIRETFELHGFSSIETRSIEPISRLTSQGEDADMIRLHLFAIPGDLPPPQVLAAAQAAIESLPPYQRPEKIHLVDHFPRTDTGKLRRNELARSTG